MSEPGQPNHPPEPNAFGWNAGGWFGGQIGSSLWLGILGGLIVFTDPLAGSVALGAFLIVNLVGLVLWSLRGSLDAYVAFQLFLTVCTISTAVAVLLLRTRQAALEYGGLPIWIPLIFPATMLIVYLRRPNRYR